MPPASVVVDQFFRCSMPAGTVPTACDPWHMLATPHVIGLPRMTRREGLLALAAIGPIGLLAACGGDDEPAPATPTEPPATISTAVAEQEQALVARYDATIAAFPDLASPLQAIRDQHSQHAIALDPQSTTSPAKVEVPEGVNRAIAALVTAETRASRQRIDACVEADDPGLARLLTFIAASESSHVPALRDLRT